MRVVIIQNFLIREETLIDTESSGSEKVIKIGSDGTGENHNKESFSLLWHGHKAFSDRLKPIPL